MNFSLNLLIRALIVFVCVKHAKTQSDFIQDYLDGKVFGVNPGPCPDKANSCKGSADTSQLPPKVQQQQVTLFKGFCCSIFDEWYCFALFFLCDGITRDLGGPDGWLQGGDVEIYELQCENMKLQNMALDVGVRKDQNVGPVGWEVSGFEQKCEGRAAWDDLKIECSGCFFGDLRMTLTGDGTFRTSPQGGKGIEFDANFYFYADRFSPTVTFQDSIPSFLEIPESECNLATEDAIGFELTSRNYEVADLTIIGITVPAGDVVEFLDLDILFLAAIEASFGVTFCEFLSQLAVTEDGQPGQLNDELSEYYDLFYDEYTSGQPDDVIYYDSNLVQATKQGEYPYLFKDRKRGAPVTKEELDLSVNFNDSSSFELISVGINDYLNEVPEDRIGLEYPKAVNEFVERLLGTEVDGFTIPNKNGSLSFDLVEQGYFIKSEYSFGWTRLEISLEKLDFKGLNTIIEFGILDNDFCENCDASERFNYSLNHTLKFGKLGIGLVTRITLKNDEWVTYSPQCDGIAIPPYPTCDADSVEYLFAANLTFENLLVDATSATAFNPDLLNELQIGQLTGIDFEGDLVKGATQVTNCILPGFYTVVFPNLNISLTNLLEPLATFQDGINEDLALFITNFVITSTTLFNSAFESEMPGFAQSDYFRGQLNSWLFNETIAAKLSKCDPYIEPETDEELDFESGAVSYLYPVINQVLGGSFITTRNTDTDINDLVQDILEYYSSEDPDFFFEPTDPVIQGTWLSKDKYEIFGSFQAYEGFGPPEENYIDFGNISIFNLNQIEGFFVEYYGSTANGIQLKLNISNTTIDLDADPDTTGDKEPNPNPLQLSMEFNVKAPNNYDDLANSDVLSPINDKVSVVLTLQDMDMLLAFDKIIVKVNQINQLKVRQVRESIPCILSALESYEITEYSLFADKLFVNVTLSPIEPGQYFGNSSFGEAVQALSDTLTEANGFPSPQYKNMVNTILNNSLKESLNALKEARFEDYDPDTCDSAEDPIGGYFSFITGFQVPNISQVIGECVAEPVPVLPPIETEKQVLNAFPNTTWLDWQTSTLGTYLENTFGTTTGADALNSLLISLANSSGTPLSDAFFIEGEDQETVSFTLFLDRDNFLFDLFGIEPLIYADDSIIPGFRAQATNITVRGINQFIKDAELFNSLSKWITEYTIRFEEEAPLDIEIDGYFEADPSFRGESGTEKIREDFELTLVLTGFDLYMQLLAAVNLDIFGNLTLGHFFDVTAGNQDIVLNEFSEECLFSCFYDEGISLAALNVSISDLEGPNFRTLNNTYFSKEFEDVVDEVIKLATKFYLDAIPNIAQNCIRTYINDNLRQQWLDSQNGACPKDPVITELPEEDQYFRFGTSVGLEKFLDFMQTNFYDEDYKGWNQLVKDITIDGGDPVVLYEEGVNELGFNNIQLTYGDVNYGKMNISIASLTIEKADSFSKVAIFEPVTEEDNYTSLNGFITGATDKNGDKKIDRLDVNFILRVDTEGVFLDEEGNPTSLKNDLAVRMSFENFTTFLEIFALVNTTEALNVRFSSVSSFNELPCLLAPVDALDPKSFILSLDGLVFNLACVGDCQFPILEVLATGGDISSSGDDNLASLFNDFIQYMVDYVTSSSAQQLIDSQLAIAEDSCAELLGLITGLIAFDTSEDFNVFQVLSIAFAGVFATGACASLLLIPLHKKRKLNRLAKFKMTQKLMTESKERLLLENEMKSLLQHPATPLLAKIVVPFVCLAHIIGLIFAITGPAINIIIQFTVLGAKTQEIILVPFSVVSTINDIWNSGAWPLALLIGLASCAWPIIKNSMLFVIWFCPTTILSRAGRKRTLTMLDIIGKWSFLDVFIVVMTLAALRTYLQLSAYSRLSFLPADTFTVDVNVTPEYGIALLCIIASTSLVVNHVESYYHEKAERANQAAEDIIRGYSGKVPARAAKRIAIKDHFFAGSDRRGRKKRVSPFKIRIILIINIFSGLLVTIGVLLPVISFTMKGLVGLLLSTVESGLAVRTYSVVDLGAIISEAPANDVIGYTVNVFFQLLFFLNNVIFPVLLVIVNTLMLSMKLSLREAQSFYSLNMIVSYWSALECFIVALIMTIVEIKQITVYIVNFISDDICANIQGLLEGILGEVNGACLDVYGNVEYGAIFLFLGVFLQLFVVYVITTLGQVVLEDRYFQSYNGLRRVDKPRKPGFMKRFVLRYMTELSKGRRNQRARKLESSEPTNSIQLMSTEFSSRQGNGAIGSSSSSPPNVGGSLEQFYSTNAGMKASSFNPSYGEEHVDV